MLNKLFFKISKFSFTFIYFLLVINYLLNAQTVPDSLPLNISLPQCISYALANQSIVKQSLLDEEITKREIRISLSGWYPQVELDANIQHYLQTPMANFPVANYNNFNDPLKYLTFPSTSKYVSSSIFSANQTLYNSNLLFAAKASKELRIQSTENTENSKIETYINVTKAFFDVLLTEEQLNVLNEDILRLQKNYKDAYNYYKNGLTDNIDYQRAEIALNNTQAEKKSTEEAIKAKYSVLKQVMGISPDKQFTVLYDSSKYESEIIIDTTKSLDFNNRIEYKLLQSALQLQSTQTSYYRWSFLPTITAFYDYDPMFQNNQFSDLYNKNNPSSMFGLKLTLPLFQGMSRLENISKSKLQYQRLQYGMDYLKSEINSEYTLALASYVSNMNELNIDKNNIKVATNIFNTVKLQYDKGIKAYLEVIVSETDLRTAELNYLNTLFKVLNSKMDLEKALGIIPVN